MDIGLLRERVSFQRTTLPITIDSVWTNTYTEISANVEQQEQDTTDTKNTRIATADYTITTRYLGNGQYGDIQALDRIVWRGQTLNISSVPVVDTLRRFCIYKARGVPTQ